MNELEDKSNAVRKFHRKAGLTFERLTFGASTINPGAVSIYADEQEQGLRAILEKARVDGFSLREEKFAIIHIRIAVPMLVALHP